MKYSNLIEAKTAMLRAGFRKEFPVQVLYKYLAQASETLDEPTLRKAVKKMHEFGMIKDTNTVGVFEWIIPKADDEIEKEIKEIDKRLDELTEEKPTPVKKEFVPRKISKEEWEQALVDCGAWTPEKAKKAELDAAAKKN